MARIAGVDIPREKRLVISLTYIYGVGPNQASAILEAIGLPEDTRVRDLTEAEMCIRDRGGVLSYLQLFSGNALTQFAIFALGIMPYITASIILQILGVVIPKLEEWQQQGAVGQRKITQWTRLSLIHI